VLGPSRPPSHRASPRLYPDEVGAKQQSLHDFVAKAPWDEAELLAAVRTFVLPNIEKQAPMRAWIIDDTSVPRKCKHSIGVGRQHCAELGKQDNCQVAVTLSVASDLASPPIALRLYLLEVWASDAARRKKAGVPDDVVFRTKPQIRLEQIRQAIEDGLPPGNVMADAGYGNDTAFHSGLADLKLDCVVGIQGAPGTQPLPARTWSGNGLKIQLLRRDETAKPVKVSALARSLPRKTWRIVRWRDGTKGDLDSRFAALRVRPSHRDYWRAEPWPQEWLLI